MANSIWDELEEVKTNDDFSSFDNAFNSKAQNNNKQSVWDNLEEVKPQSSIDDDYNLNFEDPQKKSFSENHPILASTPEALKQLGQGVIHSYPEFGKGVNDAVALLGDKTGLEGLANFGKRNAEFWGDLANRTERDAKYQGIKGLSSKETVLPTILGSIGDQATNIGMAMGGGAGGAVLSKAAGLGKIGTGIATFAGTSLPNIAQEGNYLDKIQQFQQVNGRIPTNEELKHIQNVALGEKAINTALETVSDKLLFGKILPQKALTKSFKGISQKAIEQAITEAATEGMQEGVSIGAENLLGINQGNNLERLLDSMAIGGITGSAYGGAGAALSRPIDTQLPNVDNTVQPTEALKNVSAKVLNGGKVLYDDAADAINYTLENINQPTAFDMMRNLSEQGAYTPTIEDIAPKTAEKMQRVKNAENLQANEVEVQESNTNKKTDLKAEARKRVIEKLAPKTAKKIQKENPASLEGEPIEKTKNLIPFSQDMDIKGKNGKKIKFSDLIKVNNIEDATHHDMKNGGYYRQADENIRVGLDENGDLQHYDISGGVSKKIGEPIYNESTHISEETEKIKNLAPKTLEKIENKPSFVADNDGVYEKVGENQLRNVDTNEVFTPSDISSYSEWQYDSSELRKPFEFKYDPKAKAGENADNYVLSRPEVVEAYNNYVKNPTEANREIYEDTYGKYNHEYYKIKDKFEKADKVTKLAPKTAKKIQSEKINDDSSNNDKEWKETLKRRDAIDLEIVSRAANTKKGKKYNMREIKMLIGALRNGDTHKNGLHKRAEKFLELISQPDDRITVKGGISEFAEFHNPNATDEELVNQAINNLLHNRTKPVDPMEQAFAEIEEKINNIYKYIDNTNDPNELSTKFLEDYNTLEEYGDLVASEEFEKLTYRFNEKYNELSYNSNKEVSTNEQGKILSEDEGYNKRPESNIGTEEGITKIRDKSVSRSSEKKQRQSSKLTNNEGGTHGQKQSDEGTASQTRQVGTTSERSENDRGTNDDTRRGDNSRVESERGRGISSEDKELINREYKNQHELNQAIEEYITNEKYRKYAGSVSMPQEVKEWLKKYTGAGGLEKQGAEGKGLLTEYYTPHNIVNKMWDLTKQYVDTNGAKVLEPSAGIGRFLENAPANTKFDIVEMNPISAKISKILYPDANVTTGEFQERFIDKEKNLPIKKVNGEYDIVIGNPPYGQYSGRYKGLGEGAKYEQLEAYFINRSLDSLKDNGILTFIVPSSFLRGQKGKLEIANKCELLDAYRLPNNTFETTSIGTDIIVLRKKTNGTTENKLFSDKWFNEHPEKILGEVQKGKGNWGSDIVKGDKNAVDSIDTSKSDIKATKENVTNSTKTQKSTIRKNRTIAETKRLTPKGNIEYTEYKPENPVSEEDLQYFVDTRVDGTLPKGKYKPDEKVNQYDGDLYNDFNYLQGDIYEKLDALENENISEAQKEIQRKKLMSVLPEPKELKDINLTPTSDFAREYPIKGLVYDYTTNSNIEGTTYLDKKYLDWVKNLTNSERDGINAYDIDSFVRGEKIRIRYRGNPSKEEKDNQRAEYMTKLKNAVDKTFNDFLNSELSEEERKDLADKWNRKFNKLYTPDYKKMPMIVKGLNSKFYGKDLKLQDVQVEGINYLTNKGVGLLGFEVGVGKTLAGTIATVQNMQMGRCKKPLILVPKQVKPNWIREIHEAFPNIKINDLDNLGNFSGEIEDNTISIATFQALDNIWYSPETILKLQSDVYKTGNDFNRETTKRGEEKTKERFEEFIGKAEKGNKKKHTFESLGFDHITVDEAHNFKNLFADAKADGQDGNTYSKITGAESTRAKRMFLATQYILGENNNRNVFMLTATPFNNSPLEVFNMLSYMAKDKLDNMGLYNVYQFMENYVDLSADWVVDSKNDVVFKQIAKGFKNLESLQSVIDSCMLIRSAEDAGIKRPNKHTKRVVLEATEKQLELIANAETEAIKESPDGKRNNGAVLKAISKARTATLSPDIYNNNLEVSPEDFVKNSPKLNYVAQAVEAMLKKDSTTSQLIYMPLGVDFLPKLKQYFINKNILKADEIAIIKSGVDDDKINEITDSFNDEKGKIKLIIGTNKMKEGMNLNKNSSVLYVPYMDWNPTDYMQVVGRIWRRGNKYNDIRVVVPLLKDSSDPFMFQKLDEKTSRINNIMDRGKNYIDTGELDTAEEKINMIANPDKKASMFSQIEQQKLRSEKDKLEGQLQTTKFYLNALKNAENDIKDAEDGIERKKEELKGIEDKESWTYKYAQQSLERYKKDLNKAKQEQKLLNARIKRFELDFAGKDSEENINAQIEAVDKKIENLKETTEKMRAKYKDEYEKNRNTSKSIEEHIKEFDNDTDSLYNAEPLALYRNSKKAIQDTQNDDYKFFIKGKQYKPNDIVAYGVDLATHPSYEAVKDFFRGCDDVPIRIANPEVLKKYNAAAYYNKNGVFISEDFDIPLIIHELTHFKDFVKNRGDALFRIEQKIYNAIMKVKPSSKFVYKLQDILYRNTSTEKIAYHNQDIATKRLQGDKNARFKQVARRTPSIVRGLIQITKSGRTDQESNKNRISSENSTQRETSYGREVFGRRFNGHTNGTLSEKVINKDTSNGIRQAVRDKVYEWHGNLETDRYDVDKSLNSFIQLTKQKAKDFSNRLGFNVTDKQIREIMPFLRERTELPLNLNRPELTKLYNALSETDKTNLTKLADSVSDKFEKYYNNYRDVKGEQTAESIENHISHIWDLDNKKKSLLTNYITTSSRFAKRRTIGTLAEGIDGIEINGENVQFKPKTLDYAEILKSSSDNLIKATHDSILANDIKNLKYQGEALVLPATKAPNEWIEVNHPALNKAVYLGEVGEKELPLLMKTAVKVHPEIADYVSSIFEVQKQSKFWDMYDSLNGMVKQTLLGFSGFHGYALSESSIGNIGAAKTLKELNPKKFVDAIKNGNYDIYKKEEAAKRAIKAGVQLGTPSDLQRNLVEETLKKVPFIGKYIAGAVSGNNEILWDVLHNNFKILAFNTAIENLGESVSTEQERAVAQWVNDSFGGQAWELLGVKKSSIKAASRVLLSPDWNFSTIRQAAAAINSEWLDAKLNESKIGKRIGKLTGISEENNSNGARGKIGRGFWLRSAIFFTVFYNVLNAAFREWDRDKHPELYPKEMTPFDYSIWSNSYPMENIYDRIMPKVFIGRNSDGTARMLRVGKQFREVPEFLTEPIPKLGGKTSPIINIASQVGLGMSPSDVVNKSLGKEAYLNQDIWNGYGEKAKRKEGVELAKGRVITLGKSLVPYIGSKYIGGKHEFSYWDFVAQTNSGVTKGKVYKQAKFAFENGETDKIREIKIHAYKDGLSKAEINKMVGYAEKNYKIENTKRYKKQFVSAIENRDKKELNKIKSDMEKHHLSANEQRRIYENAWKEYRKNN